MKLGSNFRNVMMKIGLLMNFCITYPQIDREKSHISCSKECAFGTKLHVLSYTSRGVKDNAPCNHVIYYVPNRKPNSTLGSRTSFSSTPDVQPAQTIAPDQVERVFFFFSSSSGTRSSGWTRLCVRDGVYDTRVCDQNL